MSDGEGEEKLSGGAIAGIVLGTIVACALLISVLLYLARRGTQPTEGDLRPVQADNASEKGLLDASHNLAVADPPKKAEIAGAVITVAAGRSRTNPTPTAPSTPSGRANGMVLPRVIDENSGGESFIDTGAVVTVLWPYTATLPDEIDLVPGMKLCVTRLYDDAWGTGQVISAGNGNVGEVGKQGAFPIACVTLGDTPISSFASL